MLNISIYPNPASNYISIVFPNEVSNVTFSIYDAAGRIVFEKSNMSGNQFNIDTYELTNGIYFLGAVYNERVYRSKIIVE
jgi:Secretion system C-terminal sorting domain